MAAEPINIFSRKIDPRGVVHLLRTLAPALQVIGPEDCWEKIIITCRKGWLRKAAVLTFLHDPEYYDGPGWPRQVLGMQGYFSQFPECDRKAEVLRLIGTFRFSLATDFEPDRSLVKDDDRLGYPISEAPPDVFGRAQSAAMERHLAINWLAHGGEIYSETDTST
jgi:hypothetical protein